MAIGHVLLGILERGPAHGYDLKRSHDQHFPSARPLAFGQVYAALAKLTADGLVEVAETQQGGGPERTTYAITAAGVDSLESWLGTTESAGPYPADELVRKTVTSLLRGADTVAFLQDQRATHLAVMRDLLAQQASAQNAAAAIAIDHTISHLDADLRWLETAAERVAADRTATA
ncbi:MAG: putative PadR family transcriptional regulator [Aeromicrobium sp.]|jgi:DNA-binding PadR family transcriptional regulator|nr:putative PadR family transcriptional regulator [Aeromicrobium sp.]